MSAPAVAVSSDGKKLALAWKDVREGMPRVWWSFTDGPKFADETAVSEEPRVPRDHPSLALDARGGFWVAWEDGSGASARIRARSSAPGAATIDLADASQGTPACPVTACGAGLVVAAWEVAGGAGGEQVFLRVVEDAGR
jgi:hypothetical protein